NYDSGIPGNDEAGQKSAWYVFSSMGFYPMAPGSGEFQLSSPIFSEIELNLDPKYYPGKRLKIVVDKNDTSKVFGSIYYNDENYGSMLTQENLEKGGKLRFSNSKK
ncbi:MAG: glycoside hydrolase family 92 protein, partial [Verrucomicrobia bacterium]|nr:glycoside hydrolase family 92 protein [Prolixibacteraceae bacterium]